VVQVQVLGEFFFSQVQGKPILDNGGRLVGRLRDMAMRWDNICPRVTGIKYAKNVQSHIDINEIEQWNEHGIKLKGKLEEERFKLLQDDEIYVNKWLMDKQIIDLKGSKLVRVNDIRLSWVRHGESAEIILVAFDIGVRGLFRRLGAEYLVKKLKNNFINWQHVKPLENRTASLRLRQEQDQLRQLHPADIADIIEDLDYQERSDFIDDLGKEIAAEALAEVNLETRVEIIEHLDSVLASDILKEMPPDEAADILVELSAKKSSELLDLMEPDEAEDVRELLSYAENTAGALMTTEYIAFSPYMTAEETINRLRELAPSAETIYYLYVVNEKEVLQGVLSLRDLIIAHPQTALNGIMRTKVITVNHSDDHRKVLEVVSKYNLLAVPVVDEQGAILGIVTVDDVLETLVPDRGGLVTFSNFMLPKRPGRGWRE